MNNADETLLKKAKEFLMITCFLSIRSIVEKITETSKLKFWLSRYIAEHRMKCGIIGGMVEVEMCFL